MNEIEKPALEKAADKVNDVIEEIALKAADASIEPDPEHIAGTSNEQLYLAEASEAGVEQNRTHRGDCSPLPNREVGKERESDEVRVGVRLRAA